MGYVYILRGKLSKSKKTVYYIGSTKRKLEIRLTEHKQHKFENAYTTRLIQQTLVAYFIVPNISVRAVEGKLKRSRNVINWITGQTKSRRAWETFVAFLTKHNIKWKLRIL